MLGKRSAQLGLFEADHLYIDHVGRDSFYGFLASQRGQIFHDEDFAELYCSNNGRDSVPPSLLTTALLLQTYNRVSDQETKERADFGLRWKVALGIGIEDRFVVFLTLLASSPMSNVSSARYWFSDLPTGDFPARLLGLIYSIFIPLAP